MPQTARPEIRRMAVFALVGAANTAICYAVYVLLVQLGWHYNLALVADYGFGVVLGFGMHRASTFADRTHLRQAFGKYVLTLVLAFAVNLVILDVLVAAEHLSPLLAQFVAMMIATATSYRLQTHWVFRSHELVNEPEGDASLPFPEQQRPAA